MPMTPQHLEASALKNVRVVPVDPEVKSAETCELSLRGVRAKAETAKPTDPMVYNVPVGAGETARHGLFEKVEIEKMTTIQDRRREAENTLNRLSAQREGCIANLCRYEVRIKLVRRKLERLRRAGVKALERETAAYLEAKPADVTDIPVTELPIPDTLEIPGFMRRPRTVAEANAIDAAAAAEIKADQAERKKRKANGRIAKMTAKQAGELSRMPLSGRDALDKIKNG